jgi:regulator of sirC expression with transglutaminase-like and TPR domain
MTSADWTEATLRTIGADGPAAGGLLIDGALALAQRSLRDVDVAPYRAHIDDLTSMTARALGRRDHVIGRRDALHAALVAANGYRGDVADYDNLDNANLVRVIDRRRGLPVALGILYIGVGRALGWRIDGLGFPGHFLIQIDHAGERRILDPFDNLRCLTAPDLRDLLKRVAGPDAELQGEHYAPVADRDLLLRLESNRKLRLMAQGRLQGALDVLAGMRMMAPDAPDLWRETGVLHAQVGNLAAAVTALENALRLGRDAASRQAAADLLDQIRGQLN